MNQEQSPFDLKRLALFFVLSMGIFYAWAWLGPRPPQPVAPLEATQVPAPPTAAPVEPIPADASAATQPGAVAEVVGEPAARRVGVSTARWNIEISNVGGRITSWKLPEHKEFGDSTKPLDLVRRRPGSVAVDGATALESALDSQDVLPLQVQTGDAALDQRLARALHVVEVDKRAAATTATARWSDGAGTSIEKILTLRDDSAIATIEAHLSVAGQPRSFALLWGPGIGNHTLGERQNTYFRRGQVAWRAGGKVRAVDRPDKASELPAMMPDWVAIEDSFFTVLFVPAAPLAVPSPAPASAPRGYSAGGVLTPDAAGKVHKKEWPDELVLAAPFTPSEPLQSMYVGPRERAVLEKLDAEFTSKRHFASLLQMGLLQPIAVGMHHILIWLHAHTNSWGASIVLLTLIIRAAMFPLTHLSLKRMRSMQEKMKVLKPREKAIQERFRKLQRSSDNKLREHQERMALYQEVGIGPAETLSGCLPLLLSIPFFWALFQLLPNAPEFRHEPFLRLWSDLSSADPYHAWPIATAVTMFISSWMSMASAPVADPMQRNMLLLLPLMFGWICWGAPLGLVVYWTINNLVQLAQQYLLNLTLPPTVSKASPAPSGRAGRKKT